MQDKRRDGTNRAQVDENTAEEIKRSRGSGTRKERAQRFKVSENVVRAIDCGMSWRKEDESKSQKKSTKIRTFISEDLAKLIKQSKGNGKSQRERALEFQVSKHVVSNIDGGKAWKNI